MCSACLCFQGMDHRGAEKLRNLNISLDEAAQCAIINRDGTRVPRNLPTTDPLSSPLAAAARRPVACSGRRRPLSPRGEPSLRRRGSTPQIAQSDVGSGTGGRGAAQSAAGRHAWARSLGGGRNVSACQLLSKRRRGCHDRWKGGSGGLIYRQGIAIVAVGPALWVRATAGAVAS